MSVISDRNKRIAQSPRHFVNSKWFVMGLDHINSKNNGVDASEMERFRRAFLHSFPFTGVRHDD
jgi:hypothetical protein